MTLSISRSHSAPNLHDLPIRKQNSSTAVQPPEGIPQKKRPTSFDFPDSVKRPRHGSVAGPRPSFVAELKSMGKKPLAPSDLVSKIWRIAQRNAGDGFTIDTRHNRVPLRPGYCVAYSATQNNFGEEGLQNTLAHALGDQGSGIIGGWKDPADGRFYFDSVHIYSTRHAAVESATEYGQIGVYDLEKRRYVPIKDVMLHDRKGLPSESFKPRLDALRNKRHQSV